MTAVLFPPQQRGAGSLQPPTPLNEGTGMVQKRVRRAPIDPYEAVQAGGPPLLLFPPHTPPITTTPPSSPPSQSPPSSVSDSGPPSGGQGNGVSTRALELTKELWPSLPVKPLPGTRISAFYKAAQVVNAMLKADRTEDHIRRVLPHVTVWSFRAIELAESRLRETGHNSQDAYLEAWRNGA